MNPYDLVNVSFNGAIMHARPTEFVYDEKSEPIKAIKLVTTCPKCGAFVEIDILTTFITDGSVLPARCSQCGPKEIAEQQPIPVPVPISAQSKEIAIMKPLVKQEEIKSKVVDVNDNGFVSNSVFVDPIALGSFKIEEL